MCVCGCVCGVVRSLKGLHHLIILPARIAPPRRARNVFITSLLKSRAATLCLIFIYRPFCVVTREASSITHHPPLLSLGETIARGLEKVMKVIPPNFGYVEEGIFRCGAPEPRHYGFLSSLGLRTCILLTEIHDEAFVHWLQESEVTIFCPLVSESQTYGTFRGVAQTYSPLSAAHVPSRSDINRVSGGRSATEVSSSGAINVNGVKGGSTKEEGHDAAAPTSSGVERNRPFIGTPNNGNHSQVEGEGWPEGNADAREEERSASTGARDWHTTSTGPATAGTSNAVRFLQENVGERQVSSKYSPVLIPDPLYFPANRSGYSVGGGVDFEAAVPSYEGKLHGLMTLSEAVVVGILHILLDPQYYPLLITCSKGRYRSGIVCGCLRKLQRWNLVSILEEYRRFAGNKSRADNEEFIELFDEELVSLELSEGRRPTILYSS